LKVYFVTTGLWEEVQVIKKVRPPRLLCSYWYFKNKPLAKFCEELGYQPEILLDSGAYSAFTKGKHVNVLDYIEYIRANRDYITNYISLDVIGDPRMTLLLYQLMRSAGLNPIPVAHYGEDVLLVDYHQEGQSPLVALGGTVPIRDKRVVAAWCADVKRKYPDTELHLLGSSSKAILESEALTSCDSSTWYIQATKGLPRTIPGRDRTAKIQRAEVNMRRIMEVFDEATVPLTDCAV
jgi:hypothetical protein